MSADVTRTPVSFMSTDEETTIHGYIWKDESLANHRGVVQIVHGMAEHIERYDDFAAFLAKNGFIVAGYDHLAHGKSISKNVQWGGLDARRGSDYLIEDVDKMRTLVTAQTPEGIPYFIFGHSMGSFVTRAYITRHGQGLAGAVICATGYIPPFISTVGNLLARLIASVKGKDYQSGFLESMGVGAYAKAVEDPRTEVDWISFNEDNVDVYLADESCGFQFPAGGYATLTALTKEVNTMKSAQAIPKRLPLLFIAGSQDPVGSMGAGVVRVSDTAKKAGVESVEVRIYDNMRHEILNEKEAKMVYEDVLAWLDAHTEEL